MTIKEICEKYGMKQVELSRRFGIPLRTVEDWHAGRRNPPPYVPGMIEALLENERQASDESDVYLIYKDDQDDCVAIRGYIHGTEADADAYLEKINEGARYEWEEYTWERLEKLEIKAEKTE